MNTRYENVCPICDIETTIIVQYDNDIPQHCPMCGEDAELESTEGQEEE